ncbi:ATPase-AAA-core domain-containing protein [Mycena venus]|uniref:ATPase-AAA-core domain-containing protein n=1 Tax=Mycena venus TaxID=2733690 RepID=A0A8H6X2Q5_9AGAR|nr:ATPase-AAA-core domain-containing protein [Mycena venus]
MPHHPTVSEARLNSIIELLKPAVAILNELHDAFSTPFVLAISSTTLSLITLVQSVKRNKDECIQFMEHIHGVLYAISNLYVDSGTTGSVPPEKLVYIGKFTQTLHKIHTFFESQQEGNRIKQFFRQSEMNTLLKECRAGLQEALDMFKIDSGAIVLDSVDEMKSKTETMHREILELISTLSDGTVSESSSMYDRLNNSQVRLIGVVSSNSFSMLPSSPKIFHGRGKELANIVTVLATESPRIAILGGGGMGKTSLARAALHHSDIVVKYEHRFFVEADSATTSIELAAQIGLHLGLKPGKDLTKPVVRSLSGKASCLLILDNLETPWEPVSSRAGVEEFLSLLADITMRGAERPAKVAWSRPFLPPLNPLSDDAARQIFADIADDSHDNEDIKQLLRLTDNMPLAVDLIAHLVDYEGCSEVLAHWEMEKTSLLSHGYDRRSSSDASITLSLSSPRVKSLPGAVDLLGLLSILPDGISDSELRQSNLPVHWDVLRCKATLLRVSLAYNDDKGRLKSLVPIREHMRQFHPPSLTLIQPLRKHLHLLLDLYQKYRGAVQMAGTLKQITSNLGNLHQILLQELCLDNPDVAEVIRCTISLNNFHRITGHGRTALMDTVPAVLPSPPDHKLEVQFITEEFYSSFYHPIGDADTQIALSVSHFEHVTDPVLQSRFYCALGYYYSYCKNEIPAALEALEKALTLARSSGDPNQQCNTLSYLTFIRWRMGDYIVARDHSREGQRLAELSGSLYDGATALWIEATCCQTLGDFRDMISMLHTARGLIGLCGMSRGNLDHQIMTTEAEVHLLKSEYAESRAIYAKVVQETSAEQDAYTYACGLYNLAELDVMLGTPAADVLQNVNKANDIFKASGNGLGVANCDKILADLKLREGDTAAATNGFQQCINSFLGNYVEGVSYCLERLADVTRWATDIQHPSTWTTVYLAHAFKSNEKLALYKALLFLGDIFLSHDDVDTAHNLFIVGLDGFTAMDIHRGRAQCMLRLSSLARKWGEPSNAVEFWKEARLLFERSLQLKDVAQINSNLATLGE